VYREKHTRSAHQKSHESNQVIREQNSPYPIPDSSGEYP
jgi:hypothetical protein